MGDARINIVLCKACARLRARSNNPYEHTLELDKRWRSKRALARSRDTAASKLSTTPSAMREVVTDVTT
eukprot:12558456-Prorocentrum_lima.AAC.1